MHPNPIFRDAENGESLAFARERSFGTLAMNADHTPLLSHIPFLISDDARQIDFHLVRSNPIARALKNTAAAAKLAVTGPDSYISPDWYELDDQVPTWNYVSVHFIGTMELQPAEDLLALLERQSELFEQRLLPKPPWLTTKMSPDALNKMMRAIVPVRLNIKDMQSTWKLGQNKPEAARFAAANQVSQHGIGAKVKTLAAHMTTPPKNN